jgi:hypothetical protein
MARRPHPFSCYFFKQAIQLLLLCLIFKQKKGLLCENRSILLPVEKSPSLAFFKSMVQQEGGQKRKQQKSNESHKKGKKKNSGA